MAPKTSASSRRATASSANKSRSKISGRTTTPKQSLPVPERLKQLFKSLCAQIDGGHFNNAIKTCDKILRLDPADNDAMQTKLFLLLQTEQYNPALVLIGAGDNTARHAFEQAYSHYRLQHEAEAEDILRAIKEEKGDEDRGMLHLEAQLKYRQGSYQAAFDLYNQLLDTSEPQSEEHSDILTNLQASQKHLDFINTDFLHALDALPSSITTSIESVPPPSQPISSVAAVLASTSSAATRPTDDAPGKVVQKVRMSRVPAGVVPGVTPPPDPERWLKKSERSTFGQGRRRKGAAGGGGATQGSTSMENATVGNTSSHSAKGTGGKGRKKK